MSFQTKSHSRTWKKSFKLLVVTCALCLVVTVCVTELKISAPGRSVRAMAYDFPTDFDFNSLMQTFKKYCKDFNEPIDPNKPSQAMEFSIKINIMDKEDRKAITEENKAIAFCFPCVSEHDSQLITKKVIVTSTISNIIENGNDLILPYKQARLLAVMIFSKVVAFKYYSARSGVLMTPMCRSIFSLTKESSNKMAQQMRIQVGKLLQILHESTVAGGEYLPNSDMSCAIVAMLNTTKCVDEAKRNQMVDRLKKQYSLRNKQYSAENFDIFSAYVTPPIPEGLDPETLLRKFDEIQLEERRLRLLRTQVEAEKLEADKLEADKLEADKLEADKLEADKLEADKLEADKLEADKKDQLDKPEQASD